MMYNDHWGTICNDLWNNKSADVACKQLKFNYALRSTTEFGPGSGTVWLDNVGCSGSESSLLDCNHGSLGVDTCEHSKDIGIICKSEMKTSCITINEEYI